MSRILIDGYNLLPLTMLPNRDKLLSALNRYKRAKGHEIMVVFDGHQKGTGTGDHYFEGDIEVVFSPIMISADDVIEGLLLKPMASSWIVVSSDRRIQKAATQAKASFISSEEFAKRMQSAPKSQTLSSPTPWMEGREEEYRVGSSKKGSGKKLPKKEAQRKKKLEKL